MRTRHMDRIMSAFPATAMTRCLPFRRGASKGESRFQAAWFMSSFEAMERFLALS